MSKPFNGAVAAYIGLGSNLDDPIEQVRSARADCAAIPGVRELAFSSLYRSSPMGPQDQPDYINAVMAVATALEAAVLLRHLQRIEQEHGRIRTQQRWGARTLDLDLLIYGEQGIDTGELTVPHPGLGQRAFVLYPLFEIAPELVVPGLGRIADLVVNCPLEGLKRID
ncbi:2-amino-4-hydroxy-6-hydroxymethyldihydropteridine diphosphokinase [Methylomicrobium sp. Wu6]|uniref:2-amino-4-hydroxy-6- hydroxymethyldihydropteridine diphosphokinase n=1 Tax=Methylomicrobium sp. Wu6 TaxID=3107928 RepID=UPI002DD6358B|nr:2-amino-4-hydroxy-6-hydroxymethyldihydropteridine diphosphokinase [Methylomicrobium sp. Wu6]MEC4748045.1 2-amino-4-hydroxy-6-hydroxymethyldihydropteridine diphosphokinase [Methylomicrobium sp. Wu6]